MDNDIKIKLLKKNINVNEVAKNWSKKDFIEAHKHLKIFTKFPVDEGYDLIKEISGGNKAKKEKVETKIKGG